MKLANKGFFEAISKDPGLKEGVNTYAGHCTYEAVASAQGISYSPLDSLINRN
jgi:alanine dehydrogenase